MSVSSLAFTQSILADSGFEYALQQPLFPGKILLWLLFMLSLLSWAIMISKAVTFFRMRRADAEFNRQFRSARQPLQLFERNYADDLSMQWVVYEHGAHEAAFQMLGSPERDATFETRLKSADGMAANQMKAVREAFTRGEDAAAARIRAGLPILSAAAAGAPFLGLLGMVWILMKTFSGSTAAEGLSAVSPGIAGGLAVMVVALLVATPAIFAQILFAAQGRERLRQLGSFKEEAIRLMERFYLAPSPVQEPQAGETAFAEEPDFAIDDEETASDFAAHHDPIEAEAPDLTGPETSDFVPDQSGLEEEEAEVPVSIGLIVDDMVQEEMPLNEIESPFETVEDGFLESEDEALMEPASEPEPEPTRRSGFKTPFTEPEINPIAQQTAGILAGGTA